MFLRVEKCSPVEKQLFITTATETIDKLYQMRRDAGDRVRRFTRD